MAIGGARANVTVVEYASVGCSHCADWQRDVFPAFKAKYIDTGKVRYVLKEMLNGDASLAAAGFLAARCAGREHYFQVVDTVYAAQSAFAKGGGTTLKDIAKTAGLDENHLAVCLNSEASIKALDARVEHSRTADNVSATPTFIIGTAKLEGEQSLAALDRAIAAATPKLKPQKRRHASVRHG